MDIKIVNNAFSAHGLPRGKKLQKIDVGFTNDVYDVDGVYIIKVCGKGSSELFFRREARLCAYFQSKLPVPQVLAYDDTKAIFDRDFLIYPKIQGENLYNVWHTFSESQRRKVTEQLCGILKKINQTDINELPQDMELQRVPSWKNKILERINKYLVIAQDMKTLSGSEIEKVREFVSRNGESLEEQEIALVYWDAHFDNIIVRGDEIVGVLDFERTELASIDFALDIVRLMVEFPKKYMSEYAERFAKDEDYQNLMSWYEEFYPELFAFSDITLRLDLYSTVHALKDLKNWPNVKSLKKQILEIVATM